MSVLFQTLQQANEIIFLHQKSNIMFSKKKLFYRVTGHITQIFVNG